MSIESKLRERWLKHVGPGEILDALMADMEVALVLACREAVRNHRGSGYVSAEVWLAEHYSLPTRTRTVLREEADPHGIGVWRINEGKVEWRRPQNYIEEWRVVEYIDQAPAVTTERLAVLGRLMANPTRTVEVPVDEADPWPEGES